MAAEDQAIIGAMVKDARHDIISAAEDVADRLQGDIISSTDSIKDRLFTMGRDTADLRAQVTAVGYQVRDGFTAAAKDAEINALKTQIEIGKQTTYLSDKIDAGNLKTVELLNALREADQDRMLIERNTELVAALDGGRFWRHRWDDGQWQSLNSRLNAFQSDLQDTRQGMVNFGTMAGVGQSSTQNTVR